MISVVGARRKRRDERDDESGEDSAAAVKPRGKRRRRGERRYAGGFTAIANEHSDARDKDRGAFHVLIELHMRAAWVPEWRTAGRGRVWLEVGQCVLGLAELAAKLGMSVETVRWKLRKLVQRGAITTEPIVGIGTVATVLSLTTLNVSTGSGEANPTFHTGSTPTSTPEAGSDERAPSGDPARSTRSSPKRHTGSTPHSTPRNSDLRSRHDVGATRHNSKEESPGRQEEIADVHAYLNKRGRRAWRAAYVSRKLTARLRRQIADAIDRGHSVDDLKCVVRGDAAELKAEFYGSNTFSERNIEHKLAKQRDSEHERDLRALDGGPWPARKARQKHALKSAAAFLRVTPREAAIAEHENYEPRFHRHVSKTWDEVKHLWDQEDGVWSRHDEVSDDA